MATTECYRTLAIWISQSLNRTNRAYLEAHQELLVDDIEQFLASLIRDSDAHADEQEELRIRLQIVHDARMRGSTVQAVREAYINVLGGLIVELPDYVRDVERQLNSITHHGWVERMVTTCKLQLREAIEHTLTDDSVMPETTAELLYRLGDLFVNASPRCLASTLHQAISYYEQSLNVYTLARYPLQHTKVLIALGNAYVHCPSEQQIAHMEKAMHYYGLSLQHYSERDIFPRNNS